MSDYELTEHALADLEDIIDYVAGIKHNPEGAAVVLDYLYQAMEEVATRPERGHPRPDLTNRPVYSYRKSKAHKYYLIFDPHSRPVRILRVVSVRRDFHFLLED